MDRSMNQPASPSARHQLRPLALVLFLLVGATALMLWRAEPPAAVAKSAAAERFSAERALDVLRGLLADGKPHPVGSPANKRLRQRLVEHLKTLGYSPELQRGLASAHGATTEVVNIIAELPGTAPGAADAVLLAAHYDSVAAGPGAGDDGAGVAALLEVARALKRSAPLKRTVVLLLDDGEEAGLLGARVFMRDHPLAKKIGVVVNVEARGSSGASMMFEMSRGNIALVRAMARGLSRPTTSSLFSAVYERLPNDTDLTVFRRRGLAGFNFGFIDEVAHYHTPRDSLANLSPASVQHQGQNALQMVRTLAAGDVPLSRAKPFSKHSDQDVEQAVWFDVLGVTLLWWPAAWTKWLALLALLLLAGSAWRHAQKTSDFSWGAMALCAGVVVPLVVVALAAGFSVVGLLRATSSARLPWQAHPWPATLALWAASFVGVALAAALVARRYPLWVRYHGIFGLWAVVTVVVAVLFPPASHLFVVPALAAGIAGLVAALVLKPFEETSGWSHWLVALSPAAIAALMWLRVAHGLRIAVGVEAHPGIVAATVLPLLTVMPVLAEMQAARQRWWPCAFGGALLVGATLLAAAVPAYSAASPQRMSIAHVQRAAPAPAQWLVDASWGTIGEPLREAAGLRPLQASPLRWLGVRKVMVGPAPALDARPPTLVSLKVELGQDQYVRRRVFAQLRSRRGAHVMGLIVPASVALWGVKLGDYPLAMRRLHNAWWPDHKLYVLLSVPPEGLRLELQFGDDAEEHPIELLDVVYGLPPAAKPLIDARGQAAVPSQGGDLSVLVTRSKI